MHYRTVLPIALACLAAGSVHAQTLPRLPAGAGLPDISKMGLPNVAGVLGYCVKNKFLGASGASSVINGLKGKPGVTSSPEFSAGEAGNISNFIINDESGHGSFCHQQSFFTEIP